MTGAFDTSGDGSRDTGSEDSAGTSGADLETTLELVGIVAVAENGVIGRDGEMPWHLPEDLAHFRDHTMGHPVLMGRVTYESILEGLGEPLPGRTSIVLTGQDLEVPHRVDLASSLGEAIRAAERAAATEHDGVDRAYVAGGASIYEQLLPALDRLVVTEIRDQPAGDTWFPDWDRDEWREVARDERDGFAFLEYVREP